MKKWLQRMYLYVHNKTACIQLVMLVYHRYAIWSITRLDGMSVDWWMWNGIGEKAMDEYSIVNLESCNMERLVI